MTAMRATAVAPTAAFPLQSMSVDDPKATFARTCIEREKRRTRPRNLEDVHHSEMDLSGVLYRNALANGLAAIGV